MFKRKIECDLYWVIILKIIIIIFTGKPIVKWLLMVNVQWMCYEVHSKESCIASVNEGGKKC